MGIRAFQCTRWEYGIMVYKQFAVLEWQLQCSLFHRALESRQNSSKTATMSCKFGQISPKDSSGDPTTLGVISVFIFGFNCARSGRLEDSGPVVGQRPSCDVQTILGASAETKPLQRQAAELIAMLAVTLLGRNRAGINPQDLVLQPGAMFTEV